MGKSLQGKACEGQLKSCSWFGSDKRRQRIGTIAAHCSSQGSWMMFPAILAMP